MIKTLTSCLLFVACTAFAQVEVEKTFDGIKTIRINTASGDCKLVKGSGTTVKVNLRHSYDDKGFTPVMNQEGSRLIVKEDFEARSVRGNAEWTITVPDNMEVRFSSGSGNFVASNLTTELDLNSGSGDIDLQGMKGEIDGTTGSGNIDLANFDGKIKLNSGSGEIYVTSSKGDVTLNCGSGDIRIGDSQAEFLASTGSGNVSGKNVTVEGLSKFNTGSGNAEILLAAAPKHSLAVNSGSGDAELNFNGNQINGQIVMRANKRNGTISTPFEFDKTEEIEGGGDDLIVQKTYTKGNSDVKISIRTGSGKAVLKEK